MPGALRCYEATTGPHEGPVTGVVRARFTELASRLLDSEVELVAVPTARSSWPRQAALLRRHHLGRRRPRLEERPVGAGFHEVRVSFLGETRIHHLCRGRATGSCSKATRSA
jgi:hypothetical protein